MMVAIKKALRTLFKKGRRNGVKILSLSIGLSMGLVLVSKILFEQTYDDFYPEIDRVFRVEEKFSIDGQLMTHPRISAPIAPGMQAEIPGVQFGTCGDWMGTKVFFDQSKNKYVADFIMADTAWFDILPRRIIVGNAKEILNTPMAVMLSQSTARKMNADISAVIGESFMLDEFPGRTFTIYGVFEDIPENTNLKYDAVISLASFLQIYQWNPLEQWIGADRFLGYVKLYPGIQPEDIKEGILQMQQRHQRMESVRLAGIELEYVLKPLETYHSDIPENKRMIVLLGIIAFALIFTAVMNYILIVISTMVARTKEVAVQKCYGASPKDIISIVMSETFVHLILSLVVALVLIFSFRSVAEEILNVSLWSLFTVKTGVVLLVICLVVFLSAGLVPAMLLIRIPIAAAFRAYKESKRKWKLGLLSLQFVAAAFLLTLLVVIAKQYHLMTNMNPGYSYENLLYTDLTGVPETERQRAIDNLRQLPFVQDVTSSHDLLLQGCSGNNIYFPGDDRELFNINDMMYVANNFFPLMQVQVIAGRNFERESDGPQSVMVSRLFADRITEIAGWTDGVVGKSVSVSGHKETSYQIIGVYENIIFGNLSHPNNEKPSIAFYTETAQRIVTIKVNAMQAGAIDQVYDSLKQILPDKDVVVNHFASGIEDLYKDSRLFRNAVLIGGLATLLILLIGLIGYTADEINRRSAEVAIRKINGATIVDIVTLFIINIVNIALPAIVVGSAVAWIVAGGWLENFAEKINLSFFLFLGSGIIVLFFILSIVILNCYEAATDNPVNSLKNE